MVARQSCGLQSSSRSDSTVAARRVAACSSLVRRYTEGGLKRSSDCRSLLVALVRSFVLFAWSPPARECAFIPALARS